MISLLETVNLILSESTECVVPELPVHYRDPYDLRATVSEASLIRDLEPSKESLDETSKKLTAARPKTTKKQKEHIENYTDDSDIASYHVNHALIDAHKNGTDPEEDMIDEHKEVHRTVSRLASNPLGHKTELYSGVGFDPKKLLGGSAGSTLHLPAHTSTTHSPLVALQHGIRTRPRTGPMGMGKTAHMIKITTTPTTKGFHVGDLSSHKNEQETVLPAGTTLKYSHTTMHNVQENPQFPVKVRLHHFTVQSQK